MSTPLKAFSLVSITLLLLCPRTGAAAESQFLLNCTNFTQQQLENINLARGVSGIISLVIATLVLSLLLLNRAHKSTLQRLFLYLTIMTVLLEISLSVQIEHHFQYSGQGRVCMAVSFISQVAAGINATFNVEIIIYLLFLVYFTMKGKQHSQSQHKSYCTNVSLELALVTIALVFPLTYMWAPFLDGNYGVNGAICWIKSVGEDCEQVGFRDQTIITAFGYTLRAIVVVATVVLVVMYCRMSYRYKEIQSPQVKLLLRQTLALSGTVVIAALLVTLISLLYVAVSFSVRQENYALWVINAAGIPLSFLLLPVIFLIYVHAINYSSNTNHRICICCRKDTDTSCWKTLSRKRKPPTVAKVQKTQHVIPVIHVQPNDSETHFTVPYTNGFTDITPSVVRLHTEQPSVNTQHHPDRQSDGRHGNIPSHTYFSAPYTNAFTQITASGCEGTNSGRLAFSNRLNTERDEGSYHRLNDTNEAGNTSQPLNDLSYTHFSVQYTGGFTHITDDNSAEL